MFALLTQDPARTPGHVENPAPQMVVDGFGQLPELASTFDDVDGLFYFTYIVCIFFFVLIVGVIAVSVVLYRRKTWDQPALSNVTHNTPLEVVWTVIPLIIVMVMFAWGFKGSLDMTTVPEAASRNLYKALAKQWSWTFTNPQGDVTDNEVWIEVDKPVAFAIESKDVLHAFYMPQMRVKRDVIPGRGQVVWFQPTKTGDYHLFCAEYCGNDHSKMYAKVHVVSAEAFAKKPWATWDDSTPAAAVKSGEGVYKAKCASCHSVDGSKLVGPSWKGLFVKNADGSITGGQRGIVEGGAKKSITVDDGYIKNSVRNPMAAIADGQWSGAMNAFDDKELPDYKLAALILYMKSLAEAK